MASAFPMGNFWNTEQDSLFVELLGFVLDIDFELEPLLIMA